MAKARGLSLLDSFALKAKVFGAAALVGAVLVMFVLPDGFIGPLSSRVRALFIKHTRTGNPLVDSVAEHQATPSTAYWHYFHVLCYAAPSGLLPLVFQKERIDAKYARESRTRGLPPPPSSSRCGVDGARERRQAASPLLLARYFLLAYLAVGAYFSGKMIRLVLILSPGCAVAAGAWVGFVIDLATQAWAEAGEEAARGAAKKLSKKARREAEEKARAEEKAAAAAAKGGGGGKPLAKAKDVMKAKSKAPKERKGGGGGSLLDELEDLWDEAAGPRRIGALLFLVLVLFGAVRYVPHCLNLASQLSEPQIMLRGRGGDGRAVIIDDFREGYWRAPHVDPAPPARAPPRPRAPAPPRVVRCR
jgi:dolichyl-diphosphooligosaccharide--protein glycosyltransferase